MDTEDFLTLVDVAYSEAITNELSDTENNRKRERELSRRYYAMKVSLKPSHIRSIPGTPSTFAIARLALQFGRIITCYDFVTQIVHNWIIEEELKEELKRN